MTLPELLTLATTTLNSVPHHPSVTPELCAAICWVESSGKPDAVGDRGKAFGLAQFHHLTFCQFRRGCRTHGESALRVCPDCSMRSLVNELNFAAAMADAKRLNYLRSLCRFHNAGRFDDANTIYCRKVAAVIKQLATPPAKTKKPARKSPTTQPSQRNTPGAGASGSDGRDSVALVSKDS